MPYSTACSTTLSNFEAGQNYKDVDDPAVTVIPIWRQHSNGGCDDNSLTLVAGVPVRLLLQWSC
jgi:isoleucyl-tRNA synthetase